MRLRARGLLAPVFLLACLAAGFLIRLEPARRVRVEFNRDPAFHIRMLRSVAESGELPAIDPLSLPPAGRPVHALSPELLYHAAAGFDRLLAGLGFAGDLDRSAVVFIALCGTLIALPLYALGRTIGLGPLTSCMASAFAVLCPAHIDRTAGPAFGPDALGALLVTCHLAALAAALAAGKGNILIAGSAVAAVTLALAIAAWPTALVLVALEPLVVLGAFLARRLRPHLIVAMAPSLALALATSLATAYLITGPFLLSRSGSLAFLTLGLLLLDSATALGTRREWRASTLRAALVGAILAASLGLGRAPAHQDLADAIQKQLGFGRRDAIGTVLLATNPDTETLRPSRWFDSFHFSAMGPLVLLYGLGRHAPRRGAILPCPPATTRAGGILFWHGAAATFFLLSVLFARTKVLAGPLLALYPALLADGMLRAPRRNRLLRFGSVALLAAALFWTANDARQLVQRIPAQLDPELRSALAWLAATGARPGGVVLADWDRGYVIQLATGLPAVIDGSVEHPETKRRIAAFAGALCAEEEDVLLDLCHTHRARFLWVSADRQRLNAAYAGLPITDDRAGGEPPASGAQTNMARLLAHPGEFPGLVPRFTAGPERIFEVLPPRPPASHGIPSNQP